jgi:hypothetical protein
MPPLAGALGTGCQAIPRRERSEVCPGHEEDEMECAIAYRHNGGKVEFILDSEDECGGAAIFANRDEAIECALGLPYLMVVPWQIVEFDEL